MAAPEDVRLVVAIDFGTTFSGFAAAHVADPTTVECYNAWGAVNGNDKVPTVIYYDKNKEAKDWGYAPKLSQDEECTVAELFKLRQCTDIKKKPPLPDWLPAETATVDYLRHLGKVLKSWIIERWGYESESDLTYPDQVRFVVSVPVEWSPSAKQNMLRMLAAADVIPDASFPNVELLSEADAAAIHCLGKSGQYNLRKGDAYVVVDCGGGTCDAATLEMVGDKTIGELTESDYSMPAGNSVDEKFLELLATRLDIDVADMQKIRQNHHKLISNFIRNFFWNVKHAFDGNCSTLRVDLGDECPKLKRLAAGLRKSGSGQNWMINITSEEVAGFFKEAVDGIISLIRRQLEGMRKRQAEENEGSSGSCPSVKKIFLVGGFGGSKYLRKRVELEFGNKVVVPQNPISGVLRGAVAYGLGFDTDKTSSTYGFNTTINTRILRYTYGTNAFSILSLLIRDDPIVFVTIARRGTAAKPGANFKEEFSVGPGQKKADATIYYTREYDAKSPDDDHVKILKEWKVQLTDPESELKKARKFEMGMSFDPTPKAYAKNSESGLRYEVTEFSVPNDERVGSRTGAQASASTSA